jgi:hypothetical protein
MERITRRKIEMATRVLEFVRAHPSTAPSYATLLARLEDRLTRAETLATQERAGRLAVRGASERKLELRLAIQSKFLPHLVRAGGQVAKERPGLVGLFRLRGVNATHSAFLTSTKAMLAQAEAERELFVRSGLAEELFDELGRAVGQFEEAAQALFAARRQHTGARADLRSVAGEILEVVGMFDGLNRFRFRSNPELQGAWDSARTVLGSVRAEFT